VQHLPPDRGEQGLNLDTVGRRLAPTVYGSPTIGRWIAAQWSRIWWVRPVFRRAQAGWNPTNASPRASRFSLSALAAVVDIRLRSTGCRPTATRIVPHVGGHVAVKPAPGSPCAPSVLELRARCSRAVAFLATTRYRRCPCRAGGRSPAAFLTDGSQSGNDTARH